MSGIFLSVISMNLQFLPYFPQNHRLYRDNISISDKSKVALICNSYDNDSDSDYYLCPTLVETI
jgi:hypothetical protein